MPRLRYRGGRTRNLSGFNMLNLGILHETLMRHGAAAGAGDGLAHAFVSRESTPIAECGGRSARQRAGACGPGERRRATYHLSERPHGHGMGIHLYGSEGVLHYDLNADRITGASRRRGVSGSKRRN
jgi:hypothetical protein